jgi:histidine triad (HIT) family protein
MSKFTPEEFKEIKAQILEQVERLPNENKEQIKKYIESLDEEGLSDFLEKNNIQVRQKELDIDKPEINKEQECIFCSIIAGKIPSYKIAENKKSIIILEINPVSKGHLIVLPKNHGTIENIPKSAMTLAQKFSKKIKKKLKAEDLKIETSSFMDHAIINIIPFYKNTPLKKYKATEQELNELKNKLEIKPRLKRKVKEKSNDFTEKKKKDFTKITEFRIP